jgi:hypothetical protein
MLQVQQGAITLVVDLATNTTRTKCGATLFVMHAPDGASLDPVSRVTLQSSAIIISVSAESSNQTSSPLVPIKNYIFNGLFLYIHNAYEES